MEFPGAPTIEATRYVTSDGRSFPARLFAVKQECAEFKVTVVDMPGEKNGADASVIKGVSKIATGGGTIKFDALHRIGADIGRRLGIALANGGYSYVALFYRNNHLYEIEGNAFVTGGQDKVDAERFQQSFELN